MGNLLGAPITEKETHSGVTPGVPYMYAVPAEDNDTDTGGNGSGSSTSAASTAQKVIDLKYGVSSMQGWRIHMEDAHICQPYLFAQERQITSTGSTGSATNDASSSNNNNDSSSQDQDQNQNQNQNQNQWRRIDLPGHSLYAVFDGHGGTFAAEYAGLNLCRVLSRQEAFVQYAKHCQDQDNSNDTNQSNTATDAEAVETQRLHRRQGLDLLEQALKDAFVDLDREILLQVQGHAGAAADANNAVPDANQPYGDPADFDEHHSHGEIASSSSPKKSNNNNNTDDDDEADEMDVSVEQNADPTNPDPRHPKSTTTATGGKYPGPTPPKDYEDAGTTAIAVVLTPTSIVCANAGDSRAVYATRKGGSSGAAAGAGGTRKVVPLSFDHKPDDEHEEKRIRLAGGYVSGGRVEGDLAVSRGLGDYRFKREKTVLRGTQSCSIAAGAAAKTPADTGSKAAAAAKKGGQDAADNDNDDDTITSDASSTSASSSPKAPDEQKVSPIPDVVVHKRCPAADEFIVVACDGIWDVQTNQECCAMVAEIFAEGETDLGLVCEEGLDICLRRGSKDNMTMLVVSMESLVIGNGGGVLARRELRDMEAASLRDSPDEGSEKRKHESMYT